jgi:hypothetical protein
VASVRPKMSLFSLSQPDLKNLRINWKIPYHFSRGSSLFDRKSASDIYSRILTVWKIPKLNFSISWLFKCSEDLLFLVNNGKYLNRRHEIILNWLHGSLSCDNSSRDKLPCDNSSRDKLPCDKSPFFELSCDMSPSY